MSPTKHEPRITVRLSDELDAKLKAAAASRGIKPGTLVREALEAALGSPDVEVPRPGFAEHKAYHAAAQPRASEPPEWVEVPPLQVRECERCQKIYTSPTLRRCNVCNGRIVPEPE